MESDYNIEDIYLDSALKKVLDTYIYNMVRDYDFVILITGNGLTRVGKTTLAQQIGAYMSKRLNKPFTVSNIFFGAFEMMKNAGIMEKSSILIDDESRDDVSAKNQMETFNKQLLTFFNECGMFNHLIILVATDFFDFCRSIAITRAELLINCVRSSHETKDKDGNPVKALERGDYDIYDREGKRMLYIYGKKNFNQYNSKFAFASGKFNKKWFVDFEQYEKRKLEFLRREREDTKDAREIRQVVKYMRDIHQLTFVKISELTGIKDDKIQYIYYDGKRKPDENTI